MSNNEDNKGKIIAITVVCCIFIIVAGFVFVEINKQNKPKQIVESQPIVTNMQEIEKAVDVAYKQGREDAKKLQKINEQKKFIENISENIKANVFMKQRLFTQEYYITVENKSDYDIEKVIYKVDYYKNVNSYKVVNHTEYINFENIKAKERQTKQIPYTYCAGWQWEMQMLVCSELEINYPPIGKAYMNE